MENIDEYKPEEQEATNTGEQANRVKYAKLQQEQWTKLERKNFSQFELRVLDTLQNLGNSCAHNVLQRTTLKVEKEVEKEKEGEESKQKKKGKKNQKAQQEEAKEVVQKEEVIEEAKGSTVYEICAGEDFYLQVIRPKLQQHGIVGKVQVEEQEEVEEVKDDKKKKDKKKGKKQVVKKEDEMRMQLAREKVQDQTVKMLEMMGIIDTYVEIKLFEEEFLKVEQAGKRIKSLKILEIKFGALMAYAEQLIKCHLASKIRSEYAFELIYFLKNVYIKYQKYQGIPTSTSHPRLQLPGLVEA